MLNGNSRLINLMVFISCANQNTAHIRKDNMDKKDLEKERKKILKELYKYKKAYQILMEYWDYFPEDGIREEVDKRLKEVKL